MLERSASILTKGSWWSRCRRLRTGRDLPNKRLEMRRWGMSKSSSHSLTKWGMRTCGKQHLKVLTRRAGNRLQIWSKERPRKILTGLESAARQVQRSKTCSHLPRRYTNTPMRAQHTLGMTLPISNKQVAIMSSLRGSRLSKKKSIEKMLSSATSRTRSWGKSWKLARDISQTVNTLARALAPKESRLWMTITVHLSAQARYSIRASSKGCQRIRL